MVMGFLNASFFFIIYKNLKRVHIQPRIGNGVPYYELSSFTKTLKPYETNFLDSESLISNRADLKIFEKLTLYIIFKIVLYIFSGLN